MSYVARFGGVSKSEFEAWYNKEFPPIEDTDVPLVLSESVWEDVASALEERMSVAFEEISESVMTDVWIGNV